MSDKQIIIDGVDVSGCSYFYKHTHICLAKMHVSGKYFNCNEWCNCDFKKLSKQLSHKTQECEELKKEVKKWKKFLDGGICDCETKAKSEQKLGKIKDRCNETLELMNKDSGTNAYAGGRCIEAENILKIIDEVEK